MFDFATPIDRHGTWCTQWDYVADRFGAADLLPFTISDMDFATAPCILDAVSQRLAHGVFGYSRWRNEAFLGAIVHWYASRFNSDIDPQSVVYGPSVIYMVAETIRQWSKEGDGVVVHTPAYDAFYNTITANRRLPAERGEGVVERVGDIAHIRLQVVAQGIEPGSPVAVGGDMGDQRRHGRGREPVATL